MYMLANILSSNVSKVSASYTEQPYTTVVKIILVVHYNLLLDLDIFNASMTQQNVDFVDIKPHNQIVQVILNITRLGTFVTITPIAKSDFYSFTNSSFA